MAIRLSQTELRDKNAAFDIESILCFLPFIIIVRGAKFQGKIKKQGANSVCKTIMLKR